MRSRIWTQKLNLRNDSGARTNDQNYVLLPNHIIDFTEQCVFYRQSNIPRMTTPRVPGVTAMTRQSNGLPTALPGPGELEGEGERQPLLTQAER